MSDLLVSAAAALAVLGLYLSIVRMRLRADGQESFRRLAIEPDEKRRGGRPLLGGLAESIALRDWGRVLHSYARRSHPTRPFSDVIAIWLMGVLGGLLLGATFFGNGPLVVLCILLGPVISNWAATKLESKRDVVIEQQLPDALELQANALRAGHSLPESLRILEQIGGPLADEMLRATRSLDLGVSLEVVLTQLGERTPEDAGMWITAMQIHRVTGGNLSAVLDTLSARLRDRARMRGEVRALTSQARLSGMVVSFAPLVFLMLMFVMSKDLMREVFSSPIGVVLLASGLSLQAIGLLWIRSILKVRL